MISTGNLLFARYVDVFGLKVSSGSSYEKRDAVVFWVKKNCFKSQWEVDMKLGLPKNIILAPTADFNIKVENLKTALSMINKII